MNRIVQSQKEGCLRDSIWRRNCDDFRPFGNGLETPPPRPAMAGSFPGYIKTKHKQTNLQQCWSCRMLQILKDHHPDVHSFASRYVSTLNSDATSIAPGIVVIKLHGTPEPAGQIPTRTRIQYMFQTQEAGTSLSRGKWYLVRKARPGSAGTNIQV